MGWLHSLSAARMLITPRPSASVCIRSLMSSIGSPKNLSPPWASMPIRPRWIAPIEAAEMLPYSVVKSLALSPTYWIVARRSFRSMISRPWSSAILKTSCSTPAWVSLRLRRRDSSSGPMSETVARTGWPASPNTSQNTAELARGVNSVMPSAARRSLSLGDSTPGAPMPDRSPFTSAMNTGTPMLAKDSAIFCRVTVLPVPVAPVMRPWRLASWGSRAMSLSLDLAMSRGSVMGFSSRWGGKRRCPGLSDKRPAWV